jgi:hypothetical protein
MVTNMYFGVIFKQWCIMHVSSRSFVMVIYSKAVNGDLKTYTSRKKPPSKSHLTLEYFGSSNLNSLHENHLKCLYSYKQASYHPISLYSFKQASCRTLFEIQCNQLNIQYSQGRF